MVSRPRLCDNNVCNELRANFLKTNAQIDQSERWFSVIGAKKQAPTLPPEKRLLQSAGNLPLENPQIDTALDHIP
jgi:hypothetical protein